LISEIFILDSSGSCNNSYYFENRIKTLPRGFPYFPQDLILGRQQKTLLPDSEVQAIIALASGSFDPQFFYENHSSLSLAEVQAHFCTLMPSVGIQRDPQILCGYRDNQAMMPVARGIRCRKINLRAIPYGRSGYRDAAGHWHAMSTETWNKDYTALPKLMAFDVDENKPGSDFSRLYSEYRCFGIHDALDIPRPLVTTINPVSMNGQYLYQMQWTVTDLADPKAAMVKYEHIRKHLCRLFGADPVFRNHVVRSPLFVAGHHRSNPTKMTTSRKLIDIVNESLWHHSIWYEPHAYTLAELHEIVRYLDELHETNVADIRHGNTTNTTNTAVVVAAAAKDEKTPVTRNKTVSITISEQRAYAARDPRSIAVGERNNFIFSVTAMKCRASGVANRFRNNEFDNVANFMAWVLPVILAINDQLPEPLSTAEVTATVGSVVKYCLSDRFRPLGRSSDEATYIANNFRWGPDYRSVGQQAKAAGLSRATWYRRQKQWNAAATMIIGKKPKSRRAITLTMNCASRNRFAPTGVFCSFSSSPIYQHPMIGNVSAVSSENRVPNVHDPPVT
jgi:hypothetical protein